MSIKVINFEEEPASKRFVEMFPNIMRCGIFGPSGCGKTNVLMTILLHHEPVASVYLCSRTSFQAKYVKLEELINSYSEKKKNCNVQFTKCTPDDLVLPEEVVENCKVIFDDVLTEGQDKIANYFLRGRHRNISCFYLAQSYTKISKKSGIRENFNYIILFKQDNVNLRQIYVEYVSDLSFEEFKLLCNKCWKLPYGFIVIDVEAGNYKQKFDHVII